MKILNYVLFALVVRKCIAWLDLVSGPNVTNIMSNYLRKGKKKKRVMRKLVYAIIIKYLKFSHVANENLAIIKNGNLLLLVQSPVAPEKDTGKEKRCQLKSPFGSQHLSIQNSTTHNQNNNTRERRRSNDHLFDHFNFLAWYIKNEIALLSKSSTCALTINNHSRVGARSCYSICAGRHSGIDELTLEFPTAVKEWTSEKGQSKLQMLDRARERS